MYLPLVAMHHLEISREVAGRCSARWPELFGQKTLESWVSGTHSGAGMLWTECLCPPETHVEVPTPSIAVFVDRACKKVIKIT